MVLKCPIWKGFAMLIDEKKNLVWSDVPDPVIGDEDVLVQIYAAALNRADLLQREGKYPSPPGCPEWMGLEIAGKIVKCGAKVSGWKEEDWNIVSGGRSFDSLWKKEMEKNLLLGLLKQDFLFSLLL